MDYQWDPNKSRINLRKHGIAFADAVFVFEDSAAITVEDEHIGEERYITIGMDAENRLLVVVFTWRGDNSIRIISARKTTPSERKQYEAHHEK